jgi:hypothetical protein
MPYLHLAACHCRRSELSSGMRLYPASHRHSPSSNLGTREFHRIVGWQRLGHEWSHAVRIEHLGHWPRRYRMMHCRARRHARRHARRRRRVPPKPVASRMDYQRSFCAVRICLKWPDESQQLGEGVSRCVLQCSLHQSPGSSSKNLPSSLQLPQSKQKNNISVSFCSELPHDLT